MTSKLFTPFSLGKLELANRVTIAPMCQYSAVDGSMTDWHPMHVGTLALSGASMMMMEATGVTPEGRITPYCVGLYSDDNEAAMARVVRFVRSISPIKIGVQLGHAGRKGSAQRPWEGRGALDTRDKRAWQTVAPSALPLAEGWPVPHALERGGMEGVKHAFVQAARRAARIGLDLIELHSTHGYLLSEFLSPLANKREDEYGGSLENRMRFPLEVFRAVRAVWDKPLGAKISGTDFAEGGWTPDEAVAYARELKRLGCDYVTVSGGGLVLSAKIPATPGYQVPFAEKVKRESGITTGAIGLISDPHHAEEIVATGKADFVSLARAMLFNPHWPWHAALVLGGEIKYPPQYDRCSPKVWPPAATLGRLA
ncbi:MAG: oxidoreductase [Betaproteobacteria bacterium RIFCSPLOWO2_12_FULL_62_13]|nr:MAG: oxidoreductase [Betaproteobacteria bacterium RIFCSPLOWO2_12_FULL_62_13]